MIFPTDPQQLSRHPSQLYEAIAEGIILPLLLYCINKKFNLIKYNKWTNVNGFDLPKELIWYEQDENEFILLLEGDAILEFEDKREVQLKKGDFLDIKAREKHRIKYTSTSQPTIWLAIFYHNS